MNKIEKAIIFPYNNQFTPILRHPDLLKSYKIVGVISPQGWKLSGKDACVINESSPIGIIVDADFEKALHSCNTVFFIEWPETYDLYDLVKNKIYQAIDHRKNIVCTFKMEDEFKEEIMKKCSTRGVSFTYLGPGRQSIDLDKIHIKNEIIFEINTPVIFVMGASENTSKFEIQLSLRENLLKQGYKVCQIGTRSYCDIVGFYPFPEFMYNCFISESQKVTLFNHYIKKLEKVEKPDIIIIGIPGSIMPYSKKITNKYGILAFEISRAVTPDAAIMSILYGNYTEDYFTHMSNTVKYKFDFEIDCFNIANVIFEDKDSEQENTMIFTTLSSQFISEKKKNFNFTGISLFNILDSRDNKAMSEFIIDRLSCQEYSSIF